MNSLQPLIFCCRLLSSQESLEQREEQAIDQMTVMAKREAEHATAAAELSQHAKQLDDRAAAWEAAAATRREQSDKVSVDEMHDIQGVSKPTANTKELSDSVTPSFTMFCQRGESVTSGLHEARLACAKLMTYRPQGQRTYCALACV